MREVKTEQKPNRRGLAIKGMRSRARVLDCVFLLLHALKCFDLEYQILFSSVDQESRVKVAAGDRALLALRFFGRGEEKPFSHQF